MKDIYIPQTFHALAKGNPVAMQFLIELFNSDTPERTLDKVEKSGIVGTDLYVLYSDICEKDLNKVRRLMDNCPIDELKAACSRQDYSGKKLVAAYM